MSSPNSPLSLRSPSFIEKPGKAPSLTDIPAPGAPEPRRASPSLPSLTFSFGFGSSLLDKLPPWVSTNLRNKRSIKMLVRSWLASWLCILILLPNVSLNALGNTAFFALLASMFMPANAPVQIFIFVVVNIMVGALMGWGFGSAAMAAALASRNQVELRQSLETVQASFAGQPDAFELFEVTIFQGDFLDTRSSAIFGAFLGVATIFFALIRAYYPKLMLMSIFGSISIDIICSYGPLFPIPEYTILESMIYSLGSYVGIGIVVTICLFPETQNYNHLAGTSGLLGKLKGMMKAQQEVLSGLPYNSLAAEDLSKRHTAMRDGVIEMFQKLSGGLTFINLEVTWGKWNGDDIKALDGPLMVVVTRIAGLTSFARMLANQENFDEEKVPTPEEEAAQQGGGFGISDTSVLRQMRMSQRTASKLHKVGLPDVMPVLKDATAELRHACSGTLASLKGVVDAVNEYRYKPTNVKVHDDAVTRLGDELNYLREAIHRFKEDKRMMLVYPFQAVLNAHKGKDSPPVRSLYLMYVFASNLIGVSEAIADLGDFVLSITRKRQRNRIWMPAGFRALWKVLKDNKPDTTDQTMGNVMGESTRPDKESQHAWEDWRYRRDPDSNPPTNFMQKVFHVIHSGYQWCSTAEAMFVWKYTIVTIALWLPGIFKHSAYFNYSEKGIWALIMAQTTLNIYASDQLFQYMMRLLGTWVGLVYGLLTWYIGNGIGNGNPYGTAAATAVFLFPLMFVRIFAPPQYTSATILFGATWTLTVGYSWIDGHEALLGDVGVGWQVAWRRWVLVVVGCFASFIVMMFPPTSGRKAVRMRNATNISGLSYIYSHLMSAWINDVENEESGLPANNTWLPVFRVKLMELSTQIHNLRPQTHVAQWEGSIRGKWPHDDYLKLCDIESDMTTNLALLGSSLYQLDTKARVAFLRKTKVVNPNFMSDVLSTFLLVSQALRTGEPLHHAQYHNLFDRVNYHGDMSYSTYDREDSKALGQLHSIMSYDYMFYASAIVAIYQILTNLDELRVITTRLCGEVPLEGYDQWREKFEHAHRIV